MRTRLFSVIACVFSFGVVGLAAQTASAICCSAPLCQQDEPPNVCWYCNINCADDQMSLAEEMIYDEVEGVCYQATQTESVPCDASIVGGA